MRNVAMEVKDSILIITIDLTKEFGRSKSGKTTIVASTEGNVVVGGVKVGVNVYK
jgi:hypothetical protein